MHIYRSLGLRTHNFRFTAINASESFLPNVYGTMSNIDLALLIFLNTSNIPSRRFLKNCVFPHRNVLPFLTLCFM